MSDLAELSNPTSPIASLSVDSDFDEEMVDQDSFPSESEKSNHDNTGSESKCGGLQQ